MLTGLLCGSIHSAQCGHMVRAGCHERLCRLVEGRGRCHYFLVFTATCLRNCLLYYKCSWVNTQSSKCQFRTIKYGTSTSFQNILSGVLSLSNFSWQLRSLRMEMQILPAPSVSEFHAPWKRNILFLCRMWAFYQKLKFLKLWEQCWKSNMSVPCFFWEDFYSPGVDTGTGTDGDFCQHAAPWHPSLMSWF